MLKAELRERVASLATKGITPGLGTLLVGNDGASRSYVTGKHRDCAEVGVASISVELPASATAEDVASAVRELNADPAVTAFIVQLPLPDGVDENSILEMIDPAKDADGLHPVNLGRLVLGVDPAAAVPGPLPCTPAGIIELLSVLDLPAGTTLDGNAVLTSASTLSPDWGNDHHGGQGGTKGSGGHDQTPPMMVATDPAR